MTDKITNPDCAMCGRTRKLTIAEGVHLLECAHCDRICKRRNCQHCPNEQKASY